MLHILCETLSKADQDSYLADPLYTNESEFGSSSEYILKYIYHIYHHKRLMQVLSSTVADALTFEDSHYY